MENKRTYIVREYKALTNDNVRIKEYILADDTDKRWWEVSYRFTNIVKKFKTGQEVMKETCSRIRVISQYEIWYTPVGRPLIKNKQ